VQRWVERAGDLPFEEVDWADRPSAPQRQARRTSFEVEEVVLRLRRELRDTSLLGESGAAAIQHALSELQRPPQPVPSVRTIGRILERRGVLDGRRRIRRPSPPPGWYLPRVAARQVELDLVDSIVELHLRGPIDLEILTLISLHGGLPAVWPGPPLHMADVRSALLAHWVEQGLPGYVQFDNAMVFAGSHARPDLGGVGRMCLGLGVTPVFAPPHETGFQAAIESFNGRWQRTCWSRGWHETMEQLRDRTAGWVAAARARHVQRIEAAPRRLAFPADWDGDRLLAPRGQAIYLRRTNEQGEATVLRQRFLVDGSWPHRLVRAEVDLDAGTIRFHALRRREPDHQPLLRELSFTAPWPRP